MNSYIKPFKYLSHYSLMENWRLVESRLRFLRETFDNSFCAKIGPHLGFPFSKGFNSLDFCTLQRIHPPK
jgi:hypothetical protein